MRASILDLLESLLVTWFILSRLWNWNYNYWKQFGFVWLVEHSCHAFLLLARKAEEKVMQCHRKMVCICECVSWDMTEEKRGHGSSMLMRVLRHVPVADGGHGDHRPPEPVRDRLEMAVRRPGLSEVDRWWEKHNTWKNERRRDRRTFRDAWSGGGALWWWWWWWWGTVGPSTRSLPLVLTSTPGPPPPVCVWIFLDK